jgi:hypothetical protein
VHLSPTDHISSFHVSIIILQVHKWKEGLASFMRQNIDGMIMSLLPSISAWQKKLSNENLSGLVCSHAVYWN